MKLKKLVCAALAAVFLLVAAGCGEVEDEGGKRKNAKSGTSVEFILTADVSGAVTDREAEAVKTVLEKRIAFYGNDGKVEFDRVSGEFQVRFTAENAKEMDVEKTVHGLCERGLFRFCRGEDEDDVILTGSADVKSATAAYDDATDDYVVNLEFTDEGGAKFSAATAELVGQKISIWMDDTMISAPTVQTAITGNSAVVTGLGSQRDAEEFANKINGGELPFTLSVAEDSIKIGR